MTRKCVYGPLGFFPRSGTPNSNSGYLGSGLPWLNLVCGGWWQVRIRVRYA